MAAPIFSHDRLFISTGFGTGCAMFDCRPPAESRRPSGCGPIRTWRTISRLSVLVGGLSLRLQERILTCIDFDSGAVNWKQRGFNQGSLLAADGKLIIYGERATLALAEISPGGYQEISKTQVLDDQTWTIPTLADGRLFVRNQKELVCLNLRKPYKAQEKGTRPRMTRISENQS